MSSRRQSPSHQISAGRGGIDALYTRRLFRISLGAIFLLAVVFFVYSPSLHGAFLLDDSNLLSENDLIRSPGGLYRIWFTSDPVDYWPVSNTTLWIEWRLWGMQPTGYHVTNVLLHGLACLLLWLVLHRLSIPAAYFAALLFAVHPVNVESIAWISQRKDALAAVFFLLSVLGYVEAERRLALFAERWYPPGVLRWQLFSLAMFVLAGLSKGSTLILPLVLVLVICWHRRPTWKDALRLAPFFGTAGALVWVNIWFQTHGGDSFRDAGWIERFLQAGAVVWFYLYKAILPFHLLFVYPAWTIDPRIAWWWIPATAVLIVTYVLWHYRRDGSRPLLFTWLYCLVAMTPVMGFTDTAYMRFSPVADHYQHLALLGVMACMAAGAGACWDRAQGPRRAAVTAASLGVFVLFSVLCFRQNGLYKDADTLYGATIAENPNCAILYNELGNVALKRDNLSEARRLFELATETKPDYADAYNNLAVTHIRLGDDKEAIRCFGRTAELDSRILDARVNLAKLYTAMGRQRDAIEQCRIVLCRRPCYMYARLRLCEALIADGQKDEAIAALKEARTAGPRNAEDENVMGLTLYNWGRVSDALQCFQEAVALDRDFGKGYVNLGVIYRELGRTKDAAEQFEQAIRCDPATPSTYRVLAEMYAALGRIEDGFVVAQKGIAAARAQGDEKKVAEIERWIQRNHFGR